MCLNQNTKCTNCGKNTDGLMTCFLDENVTRLCPDCMKDSGFCYGCGMYSAGQQSFDFIHPGFCDICWEEIEENDDCDYDEDPDWMGDEEIVFWE